MIKREELSNPNSCMSRATDDEFTFVLLARDAAAPVAIRAWVAERVRLGKNQKSDPQIVEAILAAQQMENSHSAPAICLCEFHAPEGFLSSGYRQDGELWTCPNCGKVWVHICDEAEGCRWVVAEPCPYCGSSVGTPHRIDCTIRRAGKSVSA